MSLDFREHKEKSISYLSSKMFYSNNTSWFTLRNNLFWSFESHLVWLVWNRPRLLIFGEYHKIYSFLNASFPGMAIKFLDWKSLDAWNCSQYVFSNAASAKFWGLAMLEIGNGKIGIEDRGTALGLQYLSYVGSALSNWKPSGRIWQIL